MMHLLRQVLGNVRSAVAGMIVDAVNDSGAAQTVTGRTHTGATRAAVEVAQPFGFGSVPPPDGAITHLIAIGGDPGNLIALPVANAAARFGGLLAGEVVMYGGDGSRVRIRQGGVVEIWGGTSVTVHSQTTVINAPEGCTINAAAGCAINGNVDVNGSLTATGNVSDSHGSLDRLRGHYDGHVHGTSPTTSEPDAE